MPQKQVIVVLARGGNAMSQVSCRKCMVNTFVQTPTFRCPQCGSADVYYSTDGTRPAALGEVTPTLIGGQSYGIYGATVPVD